MELGYTDEITNCIGLLFYVICWSFWHVDNDFKGLPAKNQSLAGKFVPKMVKNWANIYKTAFQEPFSFDFSASINSSLRVDNFRAQDCLNRTGNFRIVESFVPKLGKFGKNFKNTFQ